MPKFRDVKKRLRPFLEVGDVFFDARTIPERVGASGMELVNPLLAFLPTDGLTKWHAIQTLGHVLAELAAGTSEAREHARTVFRRLMWHMNEDSGNMGWGIPEAMGEALAKSPVLAKEYGRILLSYARETGKSDNYIEYGPLRRGVYWGISRFAASEHATPKDLALAFTVLSEGLSDNDTPARGIAAWGLSRIPPDAIQNATLLATTREKLTQLCQSTGSCDLYEGNFKPDTAIASLAEQALESLLKPTYTNRALPCTRQGASLLATHLVTIKNQS